MSQYDDTSESGNGQKPTRKQIDAAVLTAADAARRTFAVSQLAYEQIKLRNRERGYFGSGTSQRDRNGFPAASFDRHLYDASEGRR